MDIYIKLKKKLEISKQNKVILGDVADVFTDDAALKKRVENIKLLNNPKDGLYVISSLDAVAATAAACPGYTITNLGEMDSLISVKNKPSLSKKFPPIQWFKIAVISLVLFTGSATAIMAFHTESQVGTIFQKYHEIFFGEKVERPLILNIPYSIGLALGIIVFFNHFGMKKIKNQPSPIEVEMNVYDKEVEDTLIQTITERRGGNLPPDVEDK